MRLSPAKFNALINNFAQSMTWQRAYDCPCADANSGAAAYDCPQCKHMGVIWAAAQTVKAAVAGQKVQRAWATFGFWEAGDVVLSLGSDSELYKMGEHDRVVFSKSSVPFSIKLTRGAGDTLKFTTESINRVFWLDNASQIVEGGIPTVAANGTLTWATGEPPAGMQYSISGRKRPEYFCWGEFPQDRAHHDGAALPRRVVLRSFDLFKRGL